MEKIKNPSDYFQNRVALLLDKARHEPLSLETTLNATSGKGKILLLTFLSLVFGQIPVLSLFFGLFMTYIGIRVMLNDSRIWLPPSFTRRRIPSKIIEIGLKQVLNFLKLCNRFSKPRYDWIAEQRMASRLSGLFIALIGLSFCCMPPVPLVGYLAVGALFCMGIGLLNEDGVFIVVGYTFSTLYLALALGIIKYFSFSALVDGLKAIIL